MHRTPALFTLSVLGSVRFDPADPLVAGTDPTGRLITLYQYEWINPRPDRAIRSLTLNAAPKSPGTLYVAAVATVE